MSASALRYVSTPDRDGDLRVRIVARLFSVQRCQRARRSLDNWELSSLRMPTGTAIERLTWQKHAEGGVDVSGRRLLTGQQSLRIELGSRNLREPVNKRPFMPLLESTSCGNRPVRRANLCKHLGALPFERRWDCTQNCTPVLRQQSSAQRLRTLPEEESFGSRLRLPILFEDRVTS
jgi:hypothetical protein